jgi:hypothetical protein
MFIINDIILLLYTDTKITKFNNILIKVWLVIKAVNYIHNHWHLLLKTWVVQASHFFVLKLKYGVSP